MHEKVEQLNSGLHQLLCLVQVADLDLWCEALKLIMPISERGQWCNDKKGSPYILGLGKMRKSAYSLYCFTQTHFIRQYTIDALE